LCDNLTKTQNSHHPSGEPATLLLHPAKQPSRRELTARLAWLLPDTTGRAWLHYGVDHLAGRGRYRSTP
jgi:hypothetical protein